MKIIVMLLFIIGYIKAYVRSFYYWMEADDMLLAFIDEWELKVLVLYLIFLMK